jgi:hypothetical protein
MKAKLVNRALAVDALAVHRSQPRSLLSDASRPNARDVSARTDDDGCLCVARLVAVAQAGEPLLQIDGEPLAVVSARTVVDLSAADVGCLVVVQFERADRTRPIILGRLRPQSRGDTPVVTSLVAAAPPAIEVDGETVRITAEKEIVLRCGDASITLTRAGKVLIKGEYVSSRSSGTNRIKGGSVQIN